MKVIGSTGLSNYYGEVEIVEKDGKYYSHGGRVLGLVEKGKDIKECQDKVYSKIDSISFDGSFYRHDIGGKR